MNVPPASDPRWSDIVSGKEMPDFGFLAVRILVGTIGRKLAKDQSGANLEKCTRELREFFAQNADLPPVQEDLKKIFG